MPVAYHSVHIRRKDKVKLEAAKYEVEEYMYHVEAYYKRVQHWTNPLTRRVFLATDDTTVIDEIKKK